MRLKRFLERLLTATSRTPDDAEAGPAGVASLHSLYVRTPAMLHSADGEARLIEVSDYWLEVMGYERGEVIGRSATDFLTEESRKYAQTVTLPAYRKRGMARDVPYQFVKKSGEIIDVLLSSAAEFDADHRIVRTFTVIVDVTERKRAEAELRASEARYRSLYSRTPAMLHSIDPAGRIVAVSDRWLEVLGYEREEVIGRRSIDFLTEESRRRHAAVGLREFTQPGGVQDVPYQFVKKNGEVINVLLSAITEKDPEGHPIRSLAVLTDVTRREQAEKALKQQQQLYRLLADNSSDLVALHDRDGRVLYVSPSTETLLGYDPAEIQKLGLQGIVHPEDRGALTTCYARALRGQPAGATFRARRRAGDYVWMESLVRPVTDAEGAVVRIQSTSRDVTERKRFETELSRLAMHDPLTHLPNRNLFQDRLKQALARSRRSGVPCAVLFLDLDDFKVVNDSLGHSAGDRLLIAVSRRLGDCVRDEDTVGRFGGDEFTLLMDGVGSTEAAAEFARRVLSALVPPFPLDGHQVVVRASIGVALSGDGMSEPEDLLRFADIAMYHAKQKRKGSFHVFDPERDREAAERLGLEGRLRSAVENGELEVFYQPVFCLAEGSLCEVEALIRWRDPERGLILPREFLPVAEETGLIFDIGELVLRESCRTVRAWNSRAGSRRPLGLDVNISARHFHAPELPRLVEGVLEDTGLEPALLQLEITEEALIEGSSQLEKLKRLGVRIAVDDFGTGYSSLSYLKSLPVDSLKIDRSFISGLTRSERDEAIVQTVLTLARTLKLTVTAEGIETEAQAEKLRAMGCDMGQGFYLGRPAPAVDGADPPGYADG
ncbi:MAG: EAL domain-containing protein [Gemmatimonadota bacterium]